LLGVRYAFSNTLYGTDPYALSYFGVSLGYRYYINITEPVKAYFSGQVATVFALPTIDARFSFGLQWDINDLVAVFLQPTLGGTALLSRVEAAGLGAQSYVTLGLGVQGRF
jgi:hypothetical protein